MSTKAIELFEKHKAKVAEALPRNMPIARFKQMVAMAVYQNPDLQECDPTSFVAAAIQAAQLGLWPDQNLGHAYLVPFRDRKRKTKRVQLILGYRGLIELMMRSGKVKAVQAEVVRAGDKFSFRLGTNPEIEHVPKLNNDGDIVAAYAVATLADGTRTFQVIDRKRIERAREARAARDEGPWATDFEEMAKKTAVRALAKYLQLSIDATVAAVIDEYEERGIETAKAEEAFFVEDMDLKEKTERLKGRLKAAKAEKGPEPAKPEPQKQESKQADAQAKQDNSETAKMQQADILEGWISCLPESKRAVWLQKLKDAKNAQEIMMLRVQFGKEFGMADMNWRKLLLDRLKEKTDEPLELAKQMIEEFGIHHLANVPKPVGEVILERAKTM